MDDGAAVPARIRSFAPPPTSPASRAGIVETYSWTVVLTTPGTKVTNSRDIGHGMLTAERVHHMTGVPRPAARSPPPLGTARRRAMDRSLVHSWDSPMTVRRRQSKADLASTSSGVRRTAPSIEAVASEGESRVFEASLVTTFAAGDSPREAPGPAGRHDTRRGAVGPGELETGPNAGEKRSVGQPGGCTTSDALMPRRRGGPGADHGDRARPCRKQWLRDLAG